jgi:rare lipoprotein A
MHPASMKPSRRRPGAGPSSLGLLLALCLHVAVSSTLAMEVERTDLEPWEPVVEDRDDDVVPWPLPTPDAREETAPADVAGDASESSGEDGSSGQASAAGEVGIASFYGRRFHGRRTASGHLFDATAATAAHRTLPFGTEVTITNLANGRTVVATITDRGPYVRGRIIDVSRSLASALGFTRSGTARVRVSVAGFRPLDPAPRRTHARRPPR